MININTSQYRQIALRLNQLKKINIATINPVVQARHVQIQNKIDSLTRYFNESVMILEQNENMNNKFQNGKFKFSHFENINLPSILKKKSFPSRFGFDLQYNVKEAIFAYNQEWIKSKLKLNIGDAKASCDVKCVWFKEEKFNPDFLIDLDADLALASANLSMRAGSNKLNTTVEARGAVGALYADATCVLNKEEQTLKAAVGAAVLRGEASVAFNIFGVKIILTGQGSVLSAEANIEYSHSEKEWMFGSKLGFIAGLGFKIRVKY